MLKEINCEQFINNPIIFSNGLNTVLGDNHSTNSIGKSTLLMIVDFVFGGNSYLEKNSGAIKELGNHQFKFQFVFGSEKFYFSRSTENAEVINICDSDYHSISEIGIKAFTEKLKKLYRVKNELSFRAMVNPYSRIWGKENYNVDKPILNFAKEAESISIENFIKLFNRFRSIEETSQKIKNQKDSKKILDGLHKKNYIKKITKTEFLTNEKKLERINNEIQDIQDNLLKYTVNIEELTNKELIDLQIQKKKLIDAQSIVLNKIKRIDLNLEKKSTKSKYFKRLSEFFEKTNEDKILEIENFHNNIGEILIKELTSSKEILVSENEMFSEQIDIIDLKIASLLENVKSPRFIVDKLFDLTIESSSILNVNKFYQEKENVVEEIEILTTRFDETLRTILSGIEEQINNELIRINKEIHTEKKKVPSIKLNSKSYSYNHSSNTGTGKSYADLIEFDLTILKLTDLPFIIHDSNLFKNIEDFAIDKIIEQYLTFDKQIIIALDGINKYSEKSQQILKSTSIIELSATRKLFNRDWS